MNTERAEAQTLTESEFDVIALAHGCREVVEVEGVSVPWEKLKAELDMVHGMSEEVGNGVDEMMEG